jgi:catalase
VLSILANGPESFAGRKIGVLVTDGTDGKLLAGLKSPAKKEAVTVELVAPAAGGVEASDGKLVEAGQQVDGGPSVLYDAVILFPSSEGVSKLVSSPAARDFVTDADAHCKFIGYVSDATPLFQATGIDSSSTMGSSRSATAPTTPPASSPPAGNCTTGNARQPGEMPVPALAASGHR